MKYAIVFLLLIFTSAAAEKIPAIAELTLKSGKVLHQVEFKSFGAETVMAKYTEGAGTIRYDQLPDEVLASVKDRIPPPPTPEQAAITSAARNKKLKEEAERQKTLGKIREGKITMGMTRDQVLQAWGEPNKRIITEGLTSTREQWVYRNSDTYVYFSDGVVTSWQGSK
jgi:hypothetical protein